MTLGKHPDPEAMNPRWLRLTDGTPALTRPIRPSDADSLTRGLRRLSPEGHAYRFLHYRSKFTEAELRYLTQCDFVDHIALVLAILDEQGNELDRVGVARSVRTEPEVAEVAIVLVDEWQRHGGGTALLRHLADLAVAQGIRKWSAFMLDGNVGARRLLAQVARRLSSEPAGMGAIQTLYALGPVSRKSPPAGAKSPPH